MYFFHCRVNIFFYIALIPIRVRLNCWLVFHQPKGSTAYLTSFLYCKCSSVDVESYGVSETTQGMNRCSWDASTIPRDDGTSRLETRRSESSATPVSRPAATQQCARFFIPLSFHAFDLFFR